MKTLMALMPLVAFIGCKTTGKSHEQLQAEWEASINTFDFTPASCTDRRIQDMDLLKKAHVQSFELEENVELAVIDGKKYWLKDFRPLMGCIDPTLPERLTTAFKEQQDGRTSRLSWQVGVQSAALTSIILLPGGWAYLGVVASIGGLAYNVVNGDPDKLVEPLVAEFNSKLAQRVTGVASSSQTVTTN